jgi:NADP-dependent 3-hydroxy acid dehydrogenase YdfG
VADAVSYVANLPDHVNVLDMIIVPAAQRSIGVIDRSTK